MRAVLEFYGLNGFSGLRAVNFFIDHSDGFFGDAGFSSPLQKNNVN
jgi:hypothetical protein